MTNTSLVKIAEECAAVLTELARECERLMQLWEDAIAKQRIKQCREFTRCWHIVQDARTTVMTPHTMALWVQDLVYVGDTATAAISKIRS